MIFVFEPINDKFTKFVECERVRVKVQVAQNIYIYILWGPIVSGIQTTLEKARPNI